MDEGPTGNARHDRAFVEGDASRDVLGLVLTGGGARGAYQAGAIQAIARIAGGPRLPFPVLTGMSAGAINVAALASGADDFPGAAARLVSVWRALTPGRVFRTDALRLATLCARGLGFLGVTRRYGADRFLLDTAPLRQLLRDTLELGRLPPFFRSGLLRGVAVSTTDYTTGRTVTFFDGDPRMGRWGRGLRVAERTTLTLDHVMASAAIPLLFPPVRIGEAVLGDGGIRMLAPMSPAIHLGADRIMAISVRSIRGADRTITRPHASPPIAEIAGTLLNALFLEALELDAGRLRRVNRLLRLIPRAERLDQPLRDIGLLVLRPSEDLGELAAGVPVRLPPLLRYGLRELGAGPRGNDLLSYLAFEPVYLARIIRLGYGDTMARRHEVEAFLRAPRWDDHDRPVGVERRGEVLVP